VRELLFVVTKDDCYWQYFHAGGAGGQHRDKTSNACRVEHKASGATGLCQEYREQSKNKQTAFKRMAESAKFQAWAKKEANKKMGVEAEINKRVDEMMQEENLLIEYGVE
jgi:protein subunit release factor B